ncbi:hypothetical protein [Protaetiibacter larvae]|uniref:Polysaccharide chain length determinant N-terminal domain-containing protein n=1 Tax=Protaetiibacter larvae TaxID=2592654 RepID=A0A5C1Y917_9MICO|nr:hypothetical protein [Protaetiibacter larvae]QEO10256.1 hypothetical protein FLP23_09705 [Protaetiibacter larvae]
MDIPKYLQILWSSKWLLLVGLVVAVIAAFAAGYTISDGHLQSRTLPVYRATSTVLVGSASQPIFGSEIPGQTVAEGTTAPQARDLTQTAVVYAYIVAGSEIRAQVEEKIGALASTESISAVRRTTQPGGDEQNPGRFSLPILDIAGFSTNPSRAEEISRTANDVFQQYVADEQSDAAIPVDSRVQLSTIDEAAAVNVSKSSSILPLMATGLAVFLAFVIAAFARWNVRENRARAKAKAEQSHEAQPSTVRSTPQGLPGIPAAQLASESH